eukprot:CAMPEP_0170581746 /NCGR_PEP_ID=MMETSP0224-20130122/7207_1 /TAXON_ID=285029 /ORGANISM="Togula jolla, Strain CCCM 725" /LENGTH=107 /DNA_ID=CAMNT_0010904909 /DNA_START=16 /DNA_END=339 /DNA_ORIENTATION=+
MASLQAQLRASAGQVLKKQMGGSEEDFIEKRKLKDFFGNDRNYQQQEDSLDAGQLQEISAWQHSRSKAKALFKLCLSSSERTETMVTPKQDLKQKPCMVTTWPYQLD